MARETAAERRERENDLIEAAKREGRREALKEIRELLGVPSEARIEEMIREAIDTHEDRKH